MGLTREHAREVLGTYIRAWETQDDLVKGERKHMKEIAVLTFEDGLVSSLREYWASERLGPCDR